MTDHARSDEAPASTGASTGASIGWGWVMAYGVLLAILSAVALFWPFSATIAATWVVAGLLIVAGVGSLIAAFRHRADHRLFDVVTGVLSIGVAIWIAAQPVSGAISLTLLLAVWLGARGLLELYWGFRRSGRRGWLIAAGVINLLLMAAIVLTLPVAALVVPGTLLGISFLFAALSTITLALGMRRGERPAPLRPAL